MTTESCRRRGQPFLKGSFSRQLRAFVGSVNVAARRIRDHDVVAADGYRQVMVTRTSVTDFSFKALNAFHKSVLKISGGRIGASAFGMPVIELRTTGRTSGATRTTMLTVPVVDGDRLVLVASKGGNDRDPDWFLNLVAHPDVEVTINGKRRQLRARVATSDEKTELWPRVVATYKSYASYQRHTNRDIPLVICEPR